MTALATECLALLSSAEGSIATLRKLIRDLAVNGRLIEPPPNSPAWVWSTLGIEVSGMDSGWSPSCLDTPSPSADVWAVLRTTAVQSLRYVPGENKELPATLEPRPEAEVKVGDVLFTRAGPMNRVGISCLVDATRPRLMLSDKIIRFRPRPDRLDGRFTALCLNAGATADYLEAAKSGMAASQVNISQAKLKAAPIPVPPLPEQHRIVAKVDELMALCDRLEARQQDAEAAHARLVQVLLDSLTQAREAEEFKACWERVAGQFGNLFVSENTLEVLRQAVIDCATSGQFQPSTGSTEWRDGCLGDLVVESGSGWSPSCESRQRNDAEWGVLKVSAVSWGSFRPDENKALPASLTARPEFEVRPGDFLISRANTAHLVARSVFVEAM